MHDCFQPLTFTIVQTISRWKWFGEMSFDYYTDEIGYQFFIASPSSSCGCTSSISRSTFFSIYLFVLFDGRIPGGDRVDVGRVILDFLATYNRGVRQSKNRHKIFHFLLIENSNFVFTLQLIHVNFCSYFPSCPSSSSFALFDSWCRWTNLMYPLCGVEEIKVEIAFRKGPWGRDSGHEKKRRKIKLVNICECTRTMSTH